MNRKLVSAVVTIALLSPLSAFAGTMGGGATLPEQMTQEITLAAQLSKEAETVRLEIQKVYDAAQNLQQVPNQLWQQGVQYLKQLVQLNGQAQSLGLAGQNLSSQFEQEYPSYSTQAQATQQQYEQWANAFNNEVAGSLQADNLSLSQFQRAAGVANHRKRAGIRAFAGVGGRQSDCGHHGNRNRAAWGHRCQTAEKPGGL